jgi:hypothetical protein
VPFAPENLFIDALLCAIAYILRNGFTLQRQFITNELSGEDMNKLAILLIAIGGLLSGCVAYEIPSGEGGVHHADRDRDGGRDRADREHDGDDAPNRQDRRPDEPRRY